MAITTTIKRTTRAKKIDTLPDSSIITPSSTSQKKVDSFIEDFSQIIQKIILAKETFENLQKEITETNILWEKEQKQHELQIAERNQQEELLQKREQETYDYETALSRKKIEDEFLQKKNLWERTLEESKETVALEKKELDTLRKQVASFETEKEKIVKEACIKLQKELTERFETDNKLKEQEIKSEKAIFQLRIDNLTQEVTRQTQEIISLKKSLENTTQQLKEVAVRVIESAKPPAITKVASPSEN